MQQNILFYSNRCRYCPVFIGLLKSIGLLQNFKPICIDGQESKFPFLDNVPAIKLIGINNIFQGRQAFEFVQNWKQMKQQSLEKQQIMLDQNKLLGFSEEEMGSGKSDKFAYKDIDDALQHNYVAYGADNKQFINTLPEANKINSALHKTETRKLETERKKQDSYFEEYNQRTIMEKLSSKSV